MSTLKTVLVCVLALIAIGAIVAVGAILMGTWIDVLEAGLEPPASNSSSTTTPSTTNVAPAPSTSSTAVTTPTTATAKPGSGTTHHTSHTHTSHSSSSSHTTQTSTGTSSTFEHQEHQFSYHHDQYIETYGSQYGKDREGNSTAGRVVVVEEEEEQRSSNSTETTSFIEEENVNAEPVFNKPSEEDNVQPGASVLLVMKLPPDPTSPSVVSSKSNPDPQRSSEENVEKAKVHNKSSPVQTAADSMSSSNRNVMQLRAAPKQPKGEQETQVDRSTMPQQLVRKFEPAPEARTLVRRHPPPMLNPVQQFLIALSRTNG